MISSNFFSNSFWSSKVKILSLIALILSDLSVSQALSNSKTVSDSSFSGSKFCNTSNILHFALLKHLMGTDTPYGRPDGCTYMRLLS